MELLKTMQIYLEKTGQFPGNDYWGEQFKKAFEADSKSFPLDAPVKAANDGEWHYCEYCGAYTNMPDESCYRKPNRLSV